MRGLMMDRPLSISSLIEFGAANHATTELVSVRTEGDIHRTTYGEIRGRIAQLANALLGLGVQPGDRIATLAWNGHRHLELYYAISGIGAVCHTLNPRLSPDQLHYITNHAEDRILFLDTTFVPLIEKIRPMLPTGIRFVIMTDRAHMPENGFGALCYEDLLAPEAAEIDWPELDENSAAGLCYTSGTTGRPKGALYSHRSSVLHALLTIACVQDHLTDKVRILPVVPLFHVNAWGLPYAAPLAGSALVFPGPKLDGESLFRLMEAEAVTSAWGVPTIWLGLLAEIRKQGRFPKGLHQMVVGGSAAPRSLIEAFEDGGVSVCHAWGMTEMSPIGTQGVLPKAMEGLPKEDRMAVKAKQGRRIFGVDLKIVDEEGHALPHDGEASGELLVRGNTIVSGYFNDEEATRAAIDADGWFRTGDVARIDKDGFLTITDRAKDLIKSGGEWISSIDLENRIMAHPDVANCAVIAVPHPKWEERPLLVVVPAAGRTPDKADLLGSLEGQFAKWQWPDDVVFVEELPLTATGKVSKLTLRQQFADHKLPETA